MQGRCEEDESAHEVGKDIKGVAFRVGKCIAPGSLVFSNSPV